MRSTNSSIECINSSEGLLYNPKGIADAFSNLFSSVYNSLSTNFVNDCNQIIDNASEGNIRSLRITKTEIAYAIEKISNKRSGGMDNIPSSIIKHCPDAFLCPLSIIFDKSLREGIFPVV